MIRRSNYKLWAFGAIAIGTFGSVVDHGSVNVAHPTIAGSFDTDLPTVQWVVIGKNGGATGRNSGVANAEHNYPASHRCVFSQQVLVSAMHERGGGALSSKIPGNAGFIGAHN